MTTRTFAPIVSAICFVTGTALAHDPPNEEIEEVTELLLAAPSDVELLQTRADLWLREGRPEEAAVDLTLARALRQNDPTTALLSAEVWRLRGRLGEAEAELDPVVERGSLEARMARARVREDAGRLSDALLDYEEAMTIRPTITVALGQGRVLRALGRQRDAAAFYARAAVELGGAVVLVTSRIETLRGLGEHEDALRALQPLLDRARAKGRWLLLRAEILRDAGRDAEARSANEEALAEAERLFARRHSIAARLERARALLAVGRGAEARVELRRVAAASPHLAADANALLRTGGAR